MRTIMETIDDWITEFVGRGLLMIASIHMQHFATRSYSAHVALGEYYEELEDFVDEVAESCMGCGWNPDSVTGTEIPFTFPSAQQAVANIQAFNEFLDEMMDFICEMEDNEQEGSAEAAEYEFLSNKLQEIALLNNQTLFKLIRLS